MIRENAIELICKIHKEKIIQFCQYSQCNFHFICAKCQQNDKSHQFSHSKYIIQIADFFQNYYLQFKMTNDLLKYEINSIPKEMDKNITSQEKQIKLVEQHYEIQRQKLEQLNRQVIKEITEVLIQNKDKLIEELNIEQEKLIQNIKKFNCKIKEMDQLLNRTYEDILDYQFKKLQQMDNNSQLNLMQNNFECFMKKDQKEKISLFKKEYVDLRKKLFYNIQNLKLNMKDLNIQKIAKSINHNFINYFRSEMNYEINQSVKIRYLDILEKQQKELEKLVNIQKDIVEINQFKECKQVNIEKMSLKNTGTIKDAHSGDIYGITIHQDYLISVGTDNYINVYGFKNQKVQFKIPLISKTKNISSIQQDLNQIWTGDQDGFIQCFDYVRQKLLVRVQAHSDEILKFGSFKFVDQDTSKYIHITTDKKSKLKIWDANQILQENLGKQLILEIQLNGLLQDVDFIEEKNILAIQYQHQIVLYKLQEDVLVELQTVHMENNNMSVKLEEIDERVFMYCGNKSGELLIYELGEAQQEENMINKDKFEVNLLRCVQINQNCQFCWILVLCVNTNLGSNYVFYDKMNDQIRRELVGYNKMNIGVVLKIDCNQTKMITAGTAHIKYWNW